jgi:hypothetical protein
MCGLAVWRMWYIDDDDTWADTFPRFAPRLNDSNNNAKLMTLQSFVTIFSSLNCRENISDAKDVHSAMS